MVVFIAEKRSKTALSWTYIASITPIANTNADIKQLAKFWLGMSFFTRHSRVLTVVARFR
jgi:hypothetical protein